VSCTVGYLDLSIRQRVETLSEETRERTIGAAMTAANSIAKAERAVIFILAGGVGLSELEWADGDALVSGDRQSFVEQVSAFMNACSLAARTTRKMTTHTGLKAQLQIKTGAGWTSSYGPLLRLNRTNLGWKRSTNLDVISDIR
jgi:hypothetical protein